jgi:hypothetical protein
LAVLRHGLPCQVAYHTTFFVKWPDHLGGGAITLPLYGTMRLVPLVGVP